jgi:cobalt/nickel transport system ATP-binding protein
VHIVEVADLEYTYPDGTRALRGVSFRVRQGESVAVVGANGAGKSTLLLHLNGCLTPQKGSVRIGDFLLTKKALAEIRRTVGMVFQDADDQLFMPTVYEDVAFGPLNLGLPRHEVEARVEQALTRVGALGLRDRPPHRLSGGEKRSVAIATVLAMSPAILVMDEPSSNLDPAARRRLIKLLQSFEHTRIIASHDLDMVMEVCSRTLVFHQGKMLADGPTAEVLQDEELLAVSHLEKPLRLQGCPICGGRIGPVERQT